jgi:hypothetical protein
MLTGNDPLQKRPLPPDRRTRGGSFARAAGSFVPKIAAKAFEKFGFHTAEIMMQWPTIVGAEIAKWTQPERIRWPRPVKGADGADDGEARPGGTLVLRVEPARALDIEYRGAEIIERINRYFGYRAVEALKLIQAPLERNTGQPPHASKPVSQAEAVAAQVPAPPEVSALPDDSLKAALEALWSSVVKKP